MKIPSIVLALSASGLMGIQAAPGTANPATKPPQDQIPEPTPYHIVNRGANNRQWQRETYEKAKNGKIIAIKHSYTELASGLHYKNEKGEWVESKELIEPYATGAIARQGQFQVIFADSLNTAGAIDLQTPDGKRLLSNVLGLRYYDNSTGQAVLIAQLHDAQGDLLSDNQVIYADAFEGVKADVRYTYKIGSFEQDVILREQPPTPESFGLNPATTELEVMTEFINPPEPILTKPQGHKDADSSQDISWGAMRVGHGKAFDLGAQRDFSKQVSVKRKYISVDGRNVLLERVPLPKINAALKQLPLQSSIESKLPTIASKKVQLPKAPLAQAGRKPMSMASASHSSQKGFVLDYVLLDTDQDDMIFQADLTYYIANHFNLGGHVVFEGGTVIKYNTDPEAYPVAMELWGDLVCDTAPYRPAIFTSQNDDSVGEPISDWDKPLQYYLCAIAGYASRTIAWHDLHIKYAQQGLDGYNLQVSDSQFVNCQYPIIQDLVDGGELLGTNILIVNADSAISGVGFTALGYHFTVFGCTNLTKNWDTGTSSLSLTNSLLVNVQDVGDATIQSNYTAWVTDSGGMVLQTVGGGSCYLATNSIYRDAGTTNVDPVALAIIATRTTYPPLVYSNIPISVATTFSPQAQRDTDRPDLGYHYDSLDYAFGGVDACSNLTFNAATAVAWFELPDSYGNGYGISLTNGITTTFSGTATLPCYFVRYSIVQEGGNGLWTDKTYPGGIVNQTAYDPYNPPTLKASFTRFAHLAGDPVHFRDGSAGQPLAVKATHCEILNDFYGVYNLQGAFTNCLIDRVTFWQLTADSAYAGETYREVFQNCTFHGGFFGLVHWDAPPFWKVAIHDCAFDGTIIDLTPGWVSGVPDWTWLDADYNALYNTTFVQEADLTEMPEAHNKTPVSGFNWQSSWLGDYYLPPDSPLINVGSINANLVALYHFTTQTNQLKETNSIVDIGYHYVALDTNGVPIDINGDGIPDYLEDANGNGLVDGGELNWTNLDVDADGMPNSWEIAHGLNPFNATDAIQDNDYDGRNNLQEYQDGTDPLNSSSFSGVRLGYWRFDNTNTWLGDAGQLPVLATNVAGIPSWNTNAVLIDKTNAAILKYRDVETNGSANINLRNGTVRFWFKPDWNSSNSAGTGPGGFGRILEMGSYNPAYTNGWWSLYLTPDGNRLVFGSSTNGASGTNLVGLTTFSSNQWCQIVLTYTPTNSVLYLNGQVLTNGAAPHYPNATERTNGFTIGGDRAGTNQSKGQFDELETFNYALSTSEINSNYLASLQKDKNGNGMADIWEWNNFGYLGVDPNADPDGDGISNLGEYQNGTNPNQFDALRLGHWRFNDVPNWHDEQGLSPSDANGLYPVPSWSGDAVKMNPGQNSVLAYPRNRANGSVVVSSPAGSIRFWFKPDWSSVDGDQGQGPGDTIRLFEMGRETADATYGWLALTINPSGTKLALTTEANGIQQENAICPIKLNSQSWYEIVLAYTATNSVLFVNGLQMMTNGIGMTNLPSSTVLQQGFHLGCSWDGAHQADGSFDELETFNYSLTASNVGAAYGAIINVDSDGDGLSDVLENSLGTNPNYVDSDCDGLPDAWELAHGLNPNNPVDGTPDMIALYVQGSAIGSTNVVTVIQTNLINIFFSSFTNNAYGTPITRAVVTGAATNGVWNFCNLGSDYTNNGVSLTDAAGNPTEAKLFAFIGPCASPVIIPPTRSDWDWDGATSSYDGTPYATTLTYTNSYTNYTPGNFSFSVYVSLISYYNPYLYPHPIGGTGWANNYWWLCYIIATHNSLGFPILQTYVQNVYDYAWAAGGIPHSFLPWFYKWGNWPYWHSTYYGFILINRTGVQTEISNAVYQVNNYVNPLQSYFDNHPELIQPTDFAAVRVVNSFISPFISIDNRGYSLTGDKGAIWNYPGGTNAQTEADLALTGGTNASSGTVLKKIYPDAKRTLLITGLTNGNYDVFLYYACPSNSAPTIINGTASVPVTSPVGARYWYANIPAISIPAAVSVEECLTSSVPPWVLSGGTNYCIQLNVDSPVVPDSAHDTRIIGLQIVSHTNQVFSSALLQAQPGNESAFLIWRAPAAATNFNVYKSVGSTNSWALLASTNQLKYQDLGLTAGTTYYYKVVGVEAGGTYEPTSGVVSVVPFGCAPAAPPRIDFVNQLQIPADNGAYPITYRMLLTNSDAWDPQGYPLVFKIDAIVSGSLMINGAPFSSGNNTINADDSVVWTPPAVMGAPGTAAFRVHVYDGVNRSVNTVDVLIKQTPKTYLMGWGANNLDTFQLLGTGSANTRGANPGDIPDMPGGRAFFVQNAVGVHSFESRWHINYSTKRSWDWMMGASLADPPQRVLDLDRVMSVTTFGDESSLGRCAVTLDKHLWFWGECYSYNIGLPLVARYPSNATIPPYGVTNWDAALLPVNYDYWWPIQLDLLSPVEVMDPVTTLPMTGVASAKDNFILKDDGTLWSLGNGLSLTGRDVTQPPSDYFDGGPLGVIGMIPGQVELEGTNDANGIKPGFEIVQIVTSGAEKYGDGFALARCKNGSLWSWGTMYDGDFAIRLVDDNGDPAWKPRRMQNIETAAPSPISQISGILNHIILLREDGSVSELGYIPKLDDSRWGIVFTYGTTFVDYDTCYSTNPIAVAGLPSNIHQICAGEDFGAILTDSGDVWVWGHWLGEIYSTPCKVPHFHGILKIAVGYQNVIGVDKKGRVWGAGLNWDSILGFDDGGGFHTDAVQITGIENAVDVFSGHKPLWLGGEQFYALGTDVQGKPVGLTATPKDQGVQLSWNNYPAASSYIIYRSLNEDSGYVAIGNATLNSYLDQNPPLQNGRTYYYEISAVINGVETSPSWDVAATPIPLPDAVTNLTAINACHGAKLQWQPPANVLLSPLEGYVVMADGLQLAELFPDATSYYDSRPIIAPNCTYALIARNSAGQATNLVVLSTNSIGCEPAPTIATNKLASPSWLSVVPNGGSDQATLAWTGPTNDLWTFQKSDFDNYPGIPARGSYPGIQATETVDTFIAALAQGETNTYPLSAWLWSQFSPTNTYISNAMAQAQSMADMIDSLALADTNTFPLQAWVWFQFTTNETNAFLGTSATEASKKSAMIEALHRITSGHRITDNLSAELSYTYSLLYQLENATGWPEPNEIKIKVNVLVSTLNRILTNGLPVSNLDLFVSAVSNGQFGNGAHLRPATSNLFKSFPQGADLVQLKRMLLDDCFRGEFFTRGADWGDKLTGFRVHYHILQYLNGRKYEQTLHRDVGLGDLKYGLGAGYQDDKNFPCGVYKYSWPIPRGALCWASVSALVDGQEGDVSNEVGPQRAQGPTIWDASLRAIPGNHQVYLDWNDGADIASYHVYYSTNSAATNGDYAGPWTQVLTNLLMNRCWHTGLTNDVTYHYRVTASFYDGDTNSAYASASVVACPSNIQTNFSAYASAYDSMVQVEWTVPKTNLTDPNVINQTNWQFFVERKLATDTNSSYQVISGIGFGLAYLDSDVVNGKAYTYRVTAFDQAFNHLQALAVSKADGISTNINPSATNNLTLLTPVPGNGYVDLAWSPIRANQFSIKHALNPGGPFDVVDTLNVLDAYQSAKNTYRHIGLQNGVMHYYQIAALTPTGFELDSDIKGAMPLATLTPLPPGGFQGTLMPVGTNATILLSWNAEAGISKFQVFLQDQASMISLFAGSGTSFIYYVPNGTPDNTALHFALRAVNSQGLISDMVTTTVTNQFLDETPAVTSPVVLTIAGSSGPLTVTGPTNLALSAEVNAPGVSQVSFYDGIQIIGTVSQAPYQMTWYHVPGGNHYVTASALVQSQDASAIFGSGSSVTFSSVVFILTNNVEPQLSAYQTSVTDLQLPSPSLPISLSRFYSSRSTDTNGIFGVGWSVGWNMGSVTLSTSLDGNWTGYYQSGLGANYSISESTSHYLTVTLPNGQSIGFAPQLKDEGYQLPVASIPSQDDDININYVGFALDQGSLRSLNSDLTLETDASDSSEWNTTLDFSTFNPGQFTYTAPDGAVYTYAQPGNNELTWLITQIKDRNGNSLNYLYDADNNLTNINNSCGRNVTFNYVVPPTTPDGVTNIEVYDTIGGTNPVVVYVVSSNLLTEVHQLVDRSGYGNYVTNRYVYGTSDADANRLTDVFDARGVRVLHNVYTTNASGAFTGDLKAQISPSRTNTFQVDDNYNLTVTTTSSTATNTAKVTSDASGAISGATVPVSGTTPSSTNAVQTSYDSQGNLISQTDANGNVKTYAYDDQNRLVGQSDENGNSTAVELNEFGQPNISTDANGKQTLYVYDNAGNPTNVKDPSGTVTTYTYTAPVLDDDDNVQVGPMLSRQVQAAPFVPYAILTLNDYKTVGAIKGDLIGTTETWQDSGGNTIGTPVTTIYAYDANGNRTNEIKSRTVAGGTQYITNAYTYDAQNRVVKTVVSAGGAEILTPQTNTVTYNLLGKQATSRDAAGRVTTNVYDFNGNLIETDYPDGTVSRTSYDGFGRQDFVQERAVPASDVTTNPATRNSYDASGRVIKVEKFVSITLTKAVAVPGVDFTGTTNEVQFKMVVSNPSAVLTTTRTFYDTVGRVQFSVDARGAVSKYLYDAGGRRTNVLVYGTFYNPTNDAPPSLSDVIQSTSYNYDANGNQTTVTDAAGHKITSVYDDANRVKEVDYPANNGSGTVGRYTYYDGLGRKIQETDEAGVSTAYTYDFRGLLTSVTLAFGTTQAMTTVYAYDELGNLVRQTDAAGHSTTNKYDALGRRTARILPGGQSEGFYYDNFTGNLSRSTNFNGVVITNLYDVANRLTARIFPNGTSNSFTYTVTGQRATMKDASGSYTYIYDATDRLRTNITPQGALYYGYDAIGALTSIQSSTGNGTLATYQYDILGRLTNVVDLRLTGTQNTRYNFDAVGNLQGMKYPNGVTNLYQYDSMNRLTNQVWKLNNTSLAGFAYTLGATGNRTALAETISGSSPRNYNWAYDYLYRLTGETIGGLVNVTYNYDSVGNRTNRQSSFGPLLSTNSSYNANDWLTSDNYDANGNTTNSASKSYQYDYENRLTNFNNGQVVIVYNADGNRVKKITSTSTNLYLVDTHNPSGYAQVLEELIVSGSTTNLSKAYTYGLDLISQRQPGTSTNFFGYDGHGSTRFLANAGGNVVNVFAYDAYGTLIASNGTPETAYLYCGEQFDTDLGFYYLRARYLNPNTGRFWSMDSHQGSGEDPLSLHKYLYAKSNPITNIDPLGMWSSIGADPIHQKAIDDQLNSLSDSDRQVLKNMQTEVDKHQKASESYLHAMSDGDNETPEKAKQRANEYLKTYITDARNAEKNGGHPLALEKMGWVIHTLQDSTSPAHHGFRPWYDYAGGNYNCNEWIHAAQEAINPGPGSHLYRATAQAYKYLSAPDSDLPSDFFVGLGCDGLADQTAGAATKANNKIKQFSKGVVESFFSGFLNSIPFD